MARIIPRCRQVLSDEKSVRGLYFDSIVRRALKSFSDAKYVFAHPFISNPEAQLQRNGIIDTQSAAINYEQKNVGQIFYVHNPATGDFIVYDTYDYLDKLIGFKLSDIFYAVFYQYYEATSDECALRLAKYFKYGTDKEREIWMLRYGFSFEETELVSECIDFIDETEIKFNDRINALNEAQLQVIEQYVHE